MPEPSFDTVIVRFGGEIGIKAPFTRKQYERRLNINIKASLKHHAIQYSALSRTPGRLYIKTSRAQETADKLSQVFGVSSLSPALETSSSLEDILSLSTQLASSSFKHDKSFAVRCHRVGRHPYTSQEICKEVGNRLLKSLPELRLSVNLTHPEQMLDLEIRDKQAYLFTEVTKGVSGLPLGTQPKLVCLLKDDTRSAVACWATMKRGCPSILLYINSSSVSPRKEAESLSDIAKNLMTWAIGFPARLRIARYKCRHQKLLEKQTPREASLVRKRLMLRIAQCVAETTNAEGIVTGDSFGKDSALSTHLFRIQDEAVKGLPVYRPLLCLDDYEISSTAKRIGLRKASLEKAEPPTEARVELEEIKEIEGKMDSEKLVADAIKSMQTLELQALTPQSYP